MAEHEDFYTPEHIDEQVDALLQAFNMPDQDLHMVHDLRIVLTNADAKTDAHSLQSVLHQLLEDKHSTHRQSAELIPSLERMQQQKHGRILRMKIAHEPAKKFRPVARVFSALAAALIVAALVGSMLLLSHIHQNSNTTTGSANTSSSATHPQASLPQGIYTSSNKAVFRLASQKLPQVIWRQALPDVSKIIPAGNVVYILQSHTSGTNAVLELDASTGKILWKHAFIQPKNASLSAQTTDMVLAQNRLYVNWAITTNMSHPGGDMIYVLNALTGGQVSVYTSPLLAQTWNAMDANDGILAVGNTNLQVYNTTTNKLLWQASMTGGNTNGTVLTLKIVNNLVYAIFSNNTEEAGYGKSYIVAYQAATGKKVWQSPTFPGDALYHFVVDQNRVYFGTISTANQPFTGRVYAYNIQSNKQLWSTPVPGGAQEPFAVSNGTVYTAVDPGATAKSRAPANSHLIALDAATGTIKWQHTLDTVVLSSFCMSNGILYTGLNTGNPAMSIEVFNAAGQKLWESTQYGSSNIVPTE